jgi:uncharacterized integral membrane protein
VAAVAAVLAIANRQDVAFSLDPLSQSTPAIAVHLPLFALLFGSIVFGVLLGGFVVAVSRSGASGLRKSAGRLLPRRAAKNKTRGG